MTIKPKPAKTTIRRNTWPDSERQEYDAVLAKVCTSTNDSTARIDLFDKLLNDGIQAHRIWARDIDRGVRRDGLGAEIRRYENRTQAMMSYKGDLLSVPRRQGIQVHSSSGEVFHQRELIELCPWDQIADKRTTALKTLGTYTVRIAHYDRLLALRDLCPDAACPADAAKQLGTSVDAWLTGGNLKAA